MTHQLDVHPASDAEQITAFRNVHDVWGRGLSIEEHVQRRLTSVQHNRAQWFVGCVDGDAVTSLGMYPLQFCYRGTVQPGMAIGAVHTRADCRGKGFAPILIREVEQQVRTETGAAISLLYSDIKPEYYARLGYVECPAWEADFDPCAGGFDATATEAVDMTRVSPTDGASTLPVIYAAAHAELPVSIHRDEDYWRFLTRKSPDDDVYLLGPAARPHGYVWVGVDDEGTLLLRDGATHRAELAPLLHATVAIARERNVNRVCGWLPQTVPQHFIVRQRTDEITMLKSLSDEAVIDAEITAAAEFFHEIDHV